MADYTIATGEEYEKYMDIDAYVDHLYKPDTPSMAKIGAFQMQVFHDAFADGNIKGHQLLDIGSGPTVQSIISACTHVDEIYLSDYSKRHLERLDKWHRGDLDMQETQVQKVCDLEKKGESVQDRVKMMRQKVKKIVKIDITDSDPLKGSDAPKQFDVVTSSWCLDSAAQPMETYVKCANNIYSLVKPGGYFVLFGNTDTSVFWLGKDTYPVIKISPSQLLKVYDDAGFKILTFHLIRVPDEAVDGDGYFCLTAQRPA